MKLKTGKLNKMIEGLTGREFDVILYLVQRQDSMGAVSGVTCDDVVEAMRIPRSSYYAAMDSLEEKGFIHASHGNKEKGKNVFIYENCFARKMEDFKKGYVNINYDFILGEEFLALNVNVKKFFMRLLGLKAHMQSVKLLRDTVKKYNVFNKMDKLKELFDVEEVDGGYLFRIKEKILENDIEDRYTGNKLSCKQKVVAYCRDFNISYTTQELVDTYKTISNHIDKESGKMIAKAFDVIVKKKRLQPKLISYLCGLAY